MTGYVYEQVLEASIKYFNGNELAAKVFVDKYALRDNDDNFLELTPNDMHDRLAREFARIDAEKYGLNFDDRFGIYRSSIDKFARICLQGSPMAAVGNKYQTMSASNCVVIESPSDSMGGILESGKELAQLYKRRCGVGIDLSTLRPEGMSVSNAARTTTGAWSFADFFSYITRMVGQNSRRGALMLTLDIHHPDVVKFATMKHNLTKVTGANISVKLSDKFLKAVEDNKDYEQRWPLEGEARITKKVNAREVWNVIIDSAAKTAEPGLIMWDTMLSNLPAHCYEDFKTISTNPCCFDKDSEVWVLTKNGTKEIKTVTSNDLIWVDSEQIWAPTSGYFNAGEAMTFEVLLSNGEKLFITNNHKLGVVKPKRMGSKISHKEYELVELKHIKVGDKIACSTNIPKGIELGNIGSYEDGLILGWLAGDGCLSYREEDDIFPAMHLSFWPQEHDAAEEMLKVVNKLGYPLSLTSYSDGVSMIKRIVSSELTKDITTKYETNLWRFRTGKNDFLNVVSIDFIKGYLKAYFTADGTVSAEPTRSRWCIQLSSVEKSHLEQVKRMLTIFGIKSFIDLGREAGKSTFRGKEYDTKDCWRLSITGISNIGRFYKEIGLMAEAKLQKVRQIIDEYSTGIEKNRDYVSVVSITEIGIKEVGCIEVEKYHKFTANGIISGNSEIALSAFDSCRLISINLTGYVTNSFSKEASFDFKLFAEDIATTQQMADNLVDLEIELIDRIKARCGTKDEKELWNKLQEAGKNGRRTGVGTHGLGDTLAQLCMKYDSDQALEMVDKIYKTLRDTAYDTSAELAKVRGSFPVYNHEKEQNCAFIKKLPKSIKEKMQNYGRRNISLLTQAPTGSVSILSKVGAFDRYNVSSGVEPVFRNSYTRRKKINPDDKNVRIDFTDTLGDKWQEFEIFHSNVHNYFEHKGASPDVSKLPNYFITSDKINWNKRVELQGIEQQYLDHSISSTINLPKETTAETVGTIYLEAWKKGLKGVTVYVDGSRDGVLIEKTKQLNDSKERPITIQQSQAPTRPIELTCDIKKAKVQGEEWTLFVGLLDGKPYEVFGGLSKHVDIPNKCKTGKLIKNGKVDGVSTYNLIIGDGDDQMTIKDLVNVFENPNFGSFTRTISLALRHGAPIQYIVEQLQKDKHSDMTSFSRVTARVLKSYIQDGTKSTDKTCPTCKKDNSLIYESGCVMCSVCGWSKC